MNRLTPVLIAAFLLSAPTASRPLATESVADSVRRDFHARLLQALDMSEAQRDSLLALRSELQIELDILRSQVQDGYLIPQDGRLRYREVLDAYRAALDSVLSEEQRGLLARARGHLRAQQLDDGTGDEAEPERLVDALGMSGEQRRRWLSLLARLRAEVRALRAEGESPSHDDLRRLREQHRLAFEAILAAPQRLELERIRVERERRRLELERADLDLLDSFEEVTTDSGFIDAAEP